MLTKLNLPPLCWPACQLTAGLALGGGGSGATGHVLRHNHPISTRTTSPPTPQNLPYPYYAPLYQLGHTILWFQRRHSVLTPQHKGVAPELPFISILQNQVISIVPNQDTQGVSNISDPCIRIYFKQSWGITSHTYVNMKLEGRYVINWQVIYICNNGI